MVTTRSTESSTSSSTTPEPVDVPPVRRLSEPQVAEKEQTSVVADEQADMPAGVVGDIIKSIWEPGANATVVIGECKSFSRIIS